MRSNQVTATCITASLWALWTIWAVGQSMVAHGVEVTADVEYGGEYTSNTLRTESDEISEWMHQPGMSVQAEQDTATLQLDADYGYIRRIYTKDFWEDENRIVGGADVLWQPIRQRLDFILRHNRRESTERALQAQTQANRQIVNTTEAGSTLRFQPRASDELQLEYTFTDIRTDKTSTDSQRHNGTGRYIVDLSPNRNLTFAGSYSDIEYDSLFFPAAEYAVASIGYAQTSNELDLDVKVGYNWYDRTGRGTADDPAYDAAVAWRPVAGSTFTLSGSHQITDQSRSLGERGSDGVDENSDINAAFKETLGRLGYTQQLGRTNTLSLETYYGREKYADDVPRSNTRVGVTARFDRAMTPTTTFNAYAELSNRDFKDQADDQDELRAGLGIDHRIGRALTLNFGARYEKREASTSRSYDEWVGTIRIAYTILGAGR